MFTIWNDVKYAFRFFYRNLGFTAVVLLSIAVGIGANGAIFSFMDALLFSPLPVKNLDELVSIYSSQPNEPYSQVSYPDYQYFRENNDAFTGLTAFCYASGCANFGDRSEFLLGEVVSGDYFDVLGVSTFLGRTFLPEEDGTPGSHPVVVISRHLWEQRFASAENVVGKTVQINGRPFTIVGVTPKEFHGMLRGLSSDFWAPIAMHDVLKVGGDDLETNRDKQTFYLTGRLKPDRTIESAQAGMAALADRLARAYPDSNRDRGVSLIPAREFFIAPKFRTILFSFMTLLMGAVGVVLLIACANAANLLLAKNSARNKEIAIRLAIGASRSRLARQLLTENLVLALMGGAGGLLLALWLSYFLMTFKPYLPFELSLDMGLNLRVAAFAFFLSLATGVLFGLAPTLKALKQNLIPLLKDDSGKSGFKKSRLRNFLVVSQVASSLVLLIATGLIGVSLYKMNAVDLGFDPDRKLTLAFELNLLDFSEERRRQFFQQLEDRAKAVPGVASVAWASRLPLQMNKNTKEISIPGYETDSDRPIKVEGNEVGPAYFQTMNVPLLQGRTFTPQDGEGAPNVAVINEEMAKRFWPNESPIGKRIEMNDLKDSSLKIIGVVKTGKYRSLAESPQPYMYLPLRQHFRASPFLIVGSHNASTELIPVVRERVREIDSNVPVIAITMQDVLQTSFLSQQIAGIVIGVMGIVALLMAAVGLYGIVSYTVRLRTQEIGIRVSLGANPSDVIKLIVRQGMTLTAIGVGVGLLASLALNRFLSNLLFGLSPNDPWIVGGISLFLLSVSFTACFLPARRAARIDPMTALRCE